ncbi:hypothetical protein [Streptomyces sp. NPDC018055]|uniref:hypothetical protein n=1 Tax=Streptomyces sp. NPDC018055 TaxID=3365038 RepID=UPI0037BAF361
MTGEGGVDEIRIIGLRGVVLGGDGVPAVGRLGGGGSRAPALRERIHQGIGDADYVTALKVLRQMVRDTSGDPDRSLT